MLTEEESRVELIGRFKKYVTWKDIGIPGFEPTKQNLGRIFGKIINFSGMFLDMMSFDDLSLSCLVLDRCDLSFSSFRNCSLKSCSMLKGKYDCSIFDNSFIDCCDMSESSYRSSSFKNVVVRSTCTNFTSFEGSNLTNSKFVGNIDLSRTDFRGSRGIDFIQFFINGECGYFLNGKIVSNGDVNVSRIKECLLGLTVN